jgi:hypothetical protein
MNWRDDGTEQSREMGVVGEEDGGGEVLELWRR